MKQSKELEQYALDHSQPEEGILYELNRQTHLKMAYPQMLAGPVQGALLRMLCQMICPRNVLEIGTFTGYSAISMAQGLEDGAMVHTIEIDDEIADFAKGYIEKAGMQERIKQYLGNAVDMIPQMKADFDLVYIDADKENYPNYLKLIVPKVRPGGFIMADNALWDGKVLMQNPDEKTRGIQEFNRLAREMPELETVLLPVRDGLMIIRKKA